MTNKLLLLLLLLSSAFSQFFNLVNKMGCGIFHVFVCGFFSGFGCFNFVSFYRCFSLNHLFVVCCYFSL